MMPRILGLLLMCLSLTSCTYLRGRNELPDTSGFSLEQVKQDIRPLKLSEPYVPTEDIAGYFRFYDLDLPGSQHHFGSLQSEGQTLVGHVFEPPEPRGTLYLIHGYFDHTGTLSKLIAEALLHQYAVVSWDLPGHGFSSGDRTDTGEFDLCARQLIDVVERSDDHLPRPFHLVAHSTGCSISIEYLHRAPRNAFDGIVFLAPLIQHEHTGWGRFAYWISKPFKKKIRRVVRNNSSDKEFLAFVQKDPLHSPWMSLSYLEDLYNWNERVKDYPIWPGSMLIIQGEEDTTVDWDHNLAFLRAKVQDPEIYLLPEAKHQLANETEKLRKQVFDLVFDYLNQL